MVSEAPYKDNSMSSLPTEPAEVRQWLEWASGKLLALNIRSPAPAEPRVAWPEYAHDKRDAYGRTANTLRAATPTRLEIPLMDEILLLPGLIPDIKARRIVNARSLVTPVSGRYIYSWPKIALMVHSDRKAVARLYVGGLRSIAANLPAEKAYALRHSFGRLAL